MPHIPRRTPSMTGVRPELTMPPRAHTPIPLPAAEDRKPDRAASRNRLALDRIDPKTHEVDEKLLHKTMFGKEADVDPHTGQLVLSLGFKPHVAPATGDRR